MANGNRGRIGLPLKRNQTRSALAMSAIQEERSSLEISTRTMSNATPSSSRSCTTAATRSTSRSDSSLNPARSVQTAPYQAAADKMRVPKSTRSRSVEKFEQVESMAKIPLKAPNREFRAQSARGFTQYSLNLNPSMTSATAKKIMMSKDLMSRSEQLRSMPWLNKATPCTSSAKTTSSTGSTSTERLLPKKTKALSARSRPVPYFDDSGLDDAAKQQAKKTPAEKAIKTTTSQHSRPAPCFKNSVAAGVDLKVTRSSPQARKEGWKPRAVGTRPASSPVLSPQLKPTTSSSPTLVVGEQATVMKRTAQRRELNPTMKGPLTLTRTKSSGSLISKQAQQLPFDDFQSFTRERASSDGSQGWNDIPMLGDEPPLRPRSSSYSSPIPATAPSTVPSSKKKKKSSSRIRHYEGKFQNRRGQSLFYFSLFPPEKAAMRGIILHLHGMGDHCRRSAPLYERFCNDGFGVITYDLLNHGASDYDKFNTRAHISNFDDFVDDTNDFITFAKSHIYKVALWYWRKHHHPRHPHRREKKRTTPPELPLIISGASFGSLIGLQTVLSGKHKFHSAIWASPSIGVTWTPVLWAQWKMARPLVAAFPTAKVIPAVQHNLRSRDPKFLWRYQNDPLTSSEKITPQSGQQSLSAMIRLQQDSRVSDSDNPFCGIPMLFLAGTEDYISDQQASYKFFTTLASIDKEFKFFDGLYHMIYEEPEKEEVLQYVINWLHKRFPLETRHPNSSHVNVFKKLEPSIRSYNYVKAERTEL